MKSLLIISLSIIITIGMNYSAIAHGDKDKHSQRSENDLTRDISSKPFEIIEFLGVNKGDHVLDFLGGDGYYSQLLAEKVGTAGKVVLHTTQAYMKYSAKGIKAREEIGGFKGITRLLSEADDLKLGESQFDSAILVLGYHDLFHKDEGWDVSADKVIPQLLKSLKKGGKFLIIDHSGAKNSSNKVTKSLHRIEPSFVMQDVLKRGFKFVKSSNILKNNKDPLDILVFDPKIRRKTDRFVYLFEKK